MILPYHRQEERRLRHRRVRAKVAGTARRPRLSVFRSNRYLYAQLIDDAAGRTLASVSDLGAPAEAGALGKSLATKAKAKKIKSVIFDRGGYRYAGRVKALADGARAGGLIF